MTMTLSQILDMLATLSVFVPFAPIQVGVPALVKTAREVEKSGVFDGATVVELDDVGKDYAKAVDELIAELARQKALVQPKG